MRYTIIFTPPHAKNMAREGWTKEDIKEFICEYARVPGSRFTGYKRPGGLGYGLYKDRIPMKDTDLVPLIRDPGSSGSLLPAARGLLSLMPSEAGPPRA